MNNPYIRHKNSREEIGDFPAYGKHYNSIYGYLVLTIDKRVIFFYYDYSKLSDSNELYYEDVTDDYEIIVISSFK